MEDFCVFVYVIGNELIVCLWYIKKMTRYSKNVS
nr:MAG TPA: hypothetical protein [Caudoviricetes sp.]